MIDAVYCLSRPEREDRRKLLIPSIERAVAAGLLPDKPVIWWSDPKREDVLVPGSFSHNPGYYAATVAHRLMLEDAWKKEYDTVLILEDDARFDEEFFISFKPFMAEMQRDFPDWLGIWLGWTMQRNPVQKSWRVVLNRGCTQCHAYIVNRHGIWRILDHLWIRNQKVVDWAYCELMEIDACIYSPIRQMIGTIESVSDNYHQIQQAT